MMSRDVQERAALLIDAALSEFDRDLGASEKRLGWTKYSVKVIRSDLLKLKAIVARGDAKPEVLYRGYIRTLVDELHVSVNEDDPLKSALFAIDSYGASVMDGLDQGSPSRGL